MLCTLAINAWEGPALPTPGVYLKAPRGRTAYEVCAFIPARPGSAIVGRVKCRRLSPSDIPEGATVVGWRWARR